jgi:hypothetical protein
LYSKDEISRLKQEFWTVFGQFLALQPSAEGLKINWVNYKTGIKHLYFKMEASKFEATIAIEITHDDLGIQELMFEQFLEFRNLLKSYLNEEWDWQLHIPDENGRMVSRIQKTLKSVSIYQKADWPAIISFFKTRIVILDEFWMDAQYSFDVFK